MKKNIRSLILSLSFVFFGFGSFILNFFIFPIAKKIAKNEVDFIDFSSRVIYASWRFFVGYMSFVKLIKIKFKNCKKEDFERIQNKIIVSLHPSFIDVLILMALVPKTTCFVKKSLIKNPILKNIVSSIFIPNDIEIEDLKAETKKYLDLGFNVIIFPMGTRHKNGEKKKIKKGASLAAFENKKDILPVKIVTSEEFLSIHKPFYEAGKNLVEFEIETLDLIETMKFYDENEIIAKKNLTKEIEHALYD